VPIGARANRLPHRIPANVDGVGTPIDGSGERPVSHNAHPSTVLGVPPIAGSERTIPPAKRPRLLSRLQGTFLNAGVAWPGLPNSTALFEEGMSRRDGRER
jgi:hypothetical protein